jgi:hypothetical protein
VRRNKKGETRLKIGQPDIIRPLVSDHATEWLHLKSEQ